MLSMYDFFPEDKNKVREVPSFSRDGTPVFKKPELAGTTIAAFDRFIDQKGPNLPALIFFDFTDIRDLSCISMFEAELVKAFIVSGKPICIGIYPVKKWNGALNSSFYKNSLLAKYTKIHPAYSKVKGRDVYIIDSDFVKTFLKESDYSYSSLRFFLKKGSEKIDSEIYTDIRYFVRHLPINNDDVEENLAESVSEVIENARVHGKGDAIVRMVWHELFARDGKKFHAVEVSVIDYSHILLGEPLKKILEDKSLQPSDLDDKKNKVLAARKNHEKHFGQNYTLSSFYFISSFQKGVTSREQFASSGGTGLTCLLQTLESVVWQDWVNMYTITGDDCLWFRKGYAQLDEDGFVGFNAENDYLHNKPDERILVKLPYSFNGAIFNLTFVMEDGDNL